MVRGVITALVGVPDPSTADAMTHTGDPAEIAFIIARAEAEKRTAEANTQNRKI